MNNSGLYRLLLSAVLLATVSASLNAAETKEYVCARCGNPILRQAAVVDGQLFHPECFVCKACGEQIRDEYVKGSDGSFYHRVCLNRLQQIRCDYCTLPITAGSYTTFESHTYHEECFLKFVAPRCEVCGEPLGDSFITDFWGNRFHPQ